MTSHFRFMAGYHSVPLLVFLSQPLLGRMRMILCNVVYVPVTRMRHAKAAARIKILFGLEYT